MIQDVLFNRPFKNLPELTLGKLPRSRDKVIFFTRIETGQLIAGDFFLIGKQSGIENRRTQTTIRRQNGLLSIKGQMTADPLLATIRALFSPLGPWWSHMRLGIRLQIERSRAQFLLPLGVGLFSLSALSNLSISGASLIRFFLEVQHYWFSTFQENEKLSSAA